MHLEIFGQAQAQTILVLAHHTARNVIDHSLILALWHSDKRTLLVSGDDRLFGERNFTPRLAVVFLLFAVFVHCGRFAFVVLVVRVADKLLKLLRGNFDFLLVLSQRYREVFRDVCRHTAVLRLSILTHHRVGQVVGISRILRSVGSTIQRGIIIRLDKCISRNIDRHARLFLALIVLVICVIYKPCELLRRKLHFVAVAVAKIYDLAFAE